MKRDLFAAPDAPAAAAAPQTRRLPPGAAVESASGVRAYTVSAVNAMARNLVESAIPPLWVAGEVTGWKRHPSGHCYFALRDARAQLRCVMFRTEAQRLPADPGEGMTVRALGVLSLYEKRGDFQLVVHALEGARAGGLWRVAFERLLAKLEGEGLLAAERKRPIPRCPAAVGVVTSPVGAALQDVLQVIQRRAPWTQVVFCPARVQGDGAAQDLARAIRLFAHKTGLADVLIIGRGGGAAEDLWAFNEEVVARAIAESPIPVISAVGHEVDVTIADLVADLRAPAPSAAAARAVPDGEGLRRELEQLRERLRVRTTRRFGERERRLESLAHRLRAAARGRVVARRERLLRLAGQLEALSPLAALRRGYAVPLGKGGQVLRRSRDFVQGQHFRLQVVDGAVGCSVEEIAGAAQERERHG
ncbi:MAG: exodeoxyribonuclease VII large subunit [Gemmatimonadetes bacterium]|nr:exodeoxyribonuclease VII large subunit [Gemmatimonadota bacterium]